MPIVLLFDQAAQASGPVTPATVIDEFYEAFLDSFGNPQIGVSVAIFTDFACTQPATLYSDTTGNTVVSHVVTTTGSSDPHPGNLHFFAYAGTYYGKIGNNSPFIIIHALHEQDMASHLHDSQPATSDSADPHYDRYYTRVALALHSEGADPHGDRAYAKDYTDSKVADFQSQWEGSDADAIAAHVAQSNPNTDPTKDPHHDRYYSDTQLAAHTAIHNPHATRLQDLGDVIGTATAVEGNVLLKHSGQLVWGNVTTSGTAPQVPTADTASNHPTSPALGTLFYETDTKRLVEWNGLVWNEVGTYTWHTFTPSWTNLTIGNGTSTGKYLFTGKTAEFQIGVGFGSTTSVTGSISMTLPFSWATPSDGMERFLHLKLYSGSSFSTNFLGFGFMPTNQSVVALYAPSSTTNASLVPVDATHPNNGTTNWPSNGANFTLWGRVEIA